MSRITSLLSILVILFLYGCQNNQSKEIKEEEPLHFPTVLDTIGVDAFHRYSNNVAPPRYLTEGNYYFTYIGNHKDTIYTSLVIFGSAILGGLEKENPKKLNAYGKLLLSFQKYYLENGEERNYKGTEESNIEIQINTSKKMSGYYPIMITNKSFDTCFIGSRNQIPLIMEAKDKKGKWKPIQSRYVVGCGTGVGHIFLPPNHIAITLAPIFKGDYKTRLRLKCGKNYSKPFEGNIHYSQFEYELRSPYPY